jgi:hypothetical protein
VASPVAGPPPLTTPPLPPPTHQQLGYSIFSQDRPRSYKFITAAADADENIRTPAVATVDSAMRALLPLTPEWTSQPDYERWVMVTRILRLMWPKLTAAILKEVIKVAKPILQTELGKIPALKGVLQDVTLGGHSLLDAEHHDSFWEQCSKDLHLGDHPVRVAGMKVYETTEDTCILETVLMWGGNMAIDLSVYLKLGPVTVVVPVRVSDVQFKARARVTLSPLVDTLPCIGGVTLSLLDVPHVDFKLRLFNGPDLMAFPGVQDATRAAISFVITAVALYPNSISVPLMEDYGIPKAPKGMVHVRLQRAEVRDFGELILIEAETGGCCCVSAREGRREKGNKKPPTRTTKPPPTPQRQQHRQQQRPTQTPPAHTPPQHKHKQNQQGLRRTDIITKPDPYVELEVREGRAQRSRCIRGTQAPQWDQEMFLVVDDLVKQSMAIRVWDEDPGPKDDLMGVAQLFFTEESIVTDPETGEQRVEYQAANWIANPGKELKLAVPLRPGGGLFAGMAAMLHTRNTTVLKVAKALDEAQARAAAKAVDQAMMLAEKAARKKEDTKSLAAMEAAKGERERQQAKADAYREAASHLVDKEVELRGNGVMDPVDPREAAGTLTMTVTFLPFVRPAYDDDIETTPVKEGLAALIPFDAPPAREIVTTVSDFQKGIVTVTVLGGKGLAGQAVLSSSVDPYAEVALVDCDAARPDEKQRTRTCWNDDSPRWNSKMDFVCVSAGSYLTVTVYNKTSLVDMVLSTSLSANRFRDKVLGRVSIPIRDVVRNGVLKDTWALQEAESGTVEMRIEWQNAYMDRDLGS